MIQMKIPSEGVYSIIFFSSSIFWTCKAPTSFNQIEQRISAMKMEPLKSVLILIAFVSSTIQTSLNVVDDTYITTNQNVNHGSEQFALISNTNTALFKFQTPPE